MAQSTINSPFDAYSPFFSSGLLAPHTPRRRTISWDEFSSQAFTKPSTLSTTTSSSPPDSLAPSRNSSPCRPSSPRHDSMALDEDAAMDVDAVELRSIQKTRAQEIDDRRSLTPTPQTHGPANSGAGSHLRIPAPKISADTASPNPNAQNTPRLRRRRSSLTQATSPMNAIKSPARAAGSALLLQMQLAGVTTNPGLITRARSGSLTGAVVAATEGSSLMGRLRSGSCSNVNSTAILASASSTSAVSRVEPPKAAFRPRRGVRGRVVTLPIPAPSPPPNAPLPALPQDAKAQVSSDLLPSLDSVPSAGTAIPTTPTASKSATRTSARARGLSVSNSALDGDENTIEELREF
ncbi:hypothetical protein CVT24_010343 [Panaeolus cyanescens]|uniref:Uncharacterized protein n=1 Tax=Panaeolus cyanescens TaxID=181874 RepID=A0A409YQF6_9AGAR|nr:hypothetical protein CVT24_010343 [Panaeolus cyanescens]